MSGASLPDLRALVAEAAPEELPGLVGKLAEAQAVALARLTTPASSAAAATDSNIAVEEAARRLGVSDRWIYKKADCLPFVRRIGRRVLCSAQAVADWNDRQRR